MQAAQQTLPRLLNAREVSEATGLPTWRIYELSRNGEIPTVAVGRSYRYAAPAIRRWIDNGGTTASNGTEGR